jgi:hypothetical protein
MRTDKELFQVFAACPEWLFLLTGLPSPGPSTLRSVTVKELECRMDGLDVPDDPTQPLTVIEFQLQADAEIYLRIVTEMKEAQKQFPGRAVQGIIFFKSWAMDPRTEPWTRVVHRYVLREVLESLEAAQPDHPLVAAFQPLLAGDDQELAVQAVGYYRTIKRAKLAHRARNALLEVFVSWLEQRFKSLGKKEIEAMLLEELPNLEDTQSGKELIQIGEKRGFAEAIQQLLRLKHGPLPKRLCGRIETLAMGEMRKLFRQLPACASLAEVESRLDRVAGGNPRKTKA